MQVAILPPFLVGFVFGAYTKWLFVLRLTVKSFQVCPDLFLYASESKAQGKPFWHWSLAVPEAPHLGRTCSLTPLPLLPLLFSEGLNISWKRDNPQTSQADRAFVPGKAAIRKNKQEKQEEEKTHHGCTVGADLGTAAASLTGDQWILRGIYINKIGNGFGTIMSAHFVYIEATGLICPSNFLTITTLKNTTPSEPRKQSLLLVTFQYTGCLIRILSRFLFVIPIRTAAGKKWSGSQETQTMDQASWWIRHRTHPTLSAEAFLRTFFGIWLSNEKGYCCYVAPEIKTIIYIKIGSRPGRKTISIFWLNVLCFPTSLPKHELHCFHLAAWRVREAGETSSRMRKNSASDMTCNSCGPTCCNKKGASWPSLAAAATKKRRGSSSLRGGLRRFFRCIGVLPVVLLHIVAAVVLPELRCEARNDGLVAA